MNFFNLMNPTEKTLKFNLNCETSSNNFHSLHQEPSAFNKISVPFSNGITPTDCNSSASYDKLMEERQRLINQYLQLNIQLLQKEIEEKQKSGDVEINKKEGEVAEKKEEDWPSDMATKKIKKMNQCGHLDRAHYAKGMCCNCYHRRGRNKKPWKCGLCQNCYINEYNRKKRQEMKHNERVKTQIEEEAHRDDKESIEEKSDQI